MWSWSGLGICAAVFLASGACYGQSSEPPVIVRDLGRVASIYSETLGLVRVDGQDVIVSINEPNHGIEFATGREVANIYTIAKTFKTKPVLRSGDQLFINITEFKGF